MKKILLFCAMMAANFVSAQIDVVESTFKVNAATEMFYHYGFAEGDKVIFNFTEEQGKELKEIQIVDYHSNSPYFGDFKATKVENKVIQISKKSILKFRFINTSLSGRICKIKIQRIPASEATKNFNTNIVTKETRDTSYYTVKEKYLVSKEYKPVELIGVTESWVNSQTNLTGITRVHFSFTVPKNSVEVYYSFAASRNKEQLSSSNLKSNLFGQLTKLVEPTGTLNIALNLLTSPPGSDYCDVRLMDTENARIFTSGSNEYRYFPDYSRLNLTSGVVKFNNFQGKNMSLCVENKDLTQGIQVIVQVTSINLEEKWDERDVKKFKVETKSFLDFE